MVFSKSETKVVRNSPSLTKRIEPVCAQFLHKDETARFDGSAAVVTRQYNTHFYNREQCPLLVSVTLKLIN